MRFIMRGTGKRRGLNERSGGLSKSRGSRMASGEICGMSKMGIFLKPRSQAQRTLFLALISLSILSGSSPVLLFLVLGHMLLVFRR